MDGRLVLGLGRTQSAQWEAMKLQGHNEDTAVAASVTEMGRKWSKLRIHHTDPSSLPKERMEHGKESRMRMSAKAWVLGGLVSGGGEREQDTPEGPPLESDEKCCRLYCCGDVRGSPSEVEAFGYLDKRSVREWQVPMFDEAS